MHMAGLVLGITVTQTTPLTTTATVIGARHLRLVVGRREPVSLRGVPGLGYRLAETGSRDRGVFTAPGPAIVLTRGQPVEIAVENELSQATSVHWHGIELESYYDGVPGWGGDGKQTTPPIRPGETFVARFTPPRAGTFIYHTHLNDYIQLSTGLYGPLIVIEPGQRFEPELDKIFVLSRAGPDDDRDPFLINGSAFPDGIELRVGKRYRFRISTSLLPCVSRSRCMVTVIQKTGVPLPRTAQRCRHLKPSADQQKSQSCPAKLTISSSGQRQRVISN
jgi:hypothetical protein